MKEKTQLIDGNEIAAKREQGRQRATHDLRNRSPFVSAAAAVRSATSRINAEELLDRNSQRGLKDGIHPLDAAIRAGERDAVKAFAQEHGVNVRGRATNRSQEQERGR